MGFDFSHVGTPFRMQPGLRRLAPGAPQLTPSTPNGRHLREKMAVLASFPAQALVARPGFDAGPVLRTVAAEAALDPSPAFVVGGTPDEPAFHAPRLGWSLTSGEASGEGDAAIGALLSGLDPALRPTALLCLAFEEDFAVLDGPTTTIPWLAVCLPSRWAPEAKVGRPFAEVHGPVADNAMLIAAADSLARLVTGADRWERFVWTISADPRLHQHPARSTATWIETGRGAASPDAASDALAAVATFRTEHQTFIPIAGAAQAVFTIHVESRPLADAVCTAEEARRLHSALASMSPAVLIYRNLEPARERLLRWLNRRAASMAST
jgi:hypothetical protein